MRKDKKRYVLLDRDGSIIFERDYLSDSNLVELLPDAVNGLKRLKDLGIGLLIVSNQSGIGRGYFGFKELEQVNNKLTKLLSEEGIKIDGIFCCPHAPKENCNCRKPLTGLVDKARETLNFNPSECFVIGDKPSDIKLGKNINAITLLVRSGYGAKFEKKMDVKPDYIVDNLKEASVIIKKILYSERNESS